MAGVTMIACVNCERGDVPSTARDCPYCGNNPRKQNRLRSRAVDDELPADASGPPAPVTIILPNWVELEVAPGCFVEVGRECGTTTIDDALLPYDDVSRRHAVFSLTGDGLFVTDLAFDRKREFGGTFIGEVQLTLGIATAVEPGQIVRLGRDCYLKTKKNDG